MLGRILLSLLHEFLGTLVADGDQSSTSTADGNARGRRTLTSALSGGYGAGTAQAHVRVGDRALPSHGFCRDDGGISSGKRAPVSDVPRPV